MLTPAAVIRREEGADLVSLGGAEFVVAGERFLPMAAGSAGVAAGLVAAGQAVMGAGLLVFVVRLNRQAERGGMPAARVAGPLGGEEGLAQAVERDRLTGWVAQLTVLSQRLLEPADGLPVMALPCRSPSSRYRASACRNWLAAPVYWPSCRAMKPSLLRMLASPCRSSSSRSRASACC